MKSVKREKGGERSIVSQMKKNETEMENVMSKSQIQTEKEKDEDEKKEDKEDKENNLKSSANSFKRTLHEVIIQISCYYNIFSKFSTTPVEDS